MRQDEKERKHELSEEERELFGNHNVLKGIHKAVTGKHHYPLWNKIPKV